MAELPEPDRAGFSFQRSVPPTAGLSRRFLAVVFDFLVVGLLAWAVAYGMLSVGYHPDLGQADPTRSLAGLGWLVLILELPLNLVYFTLLEGLVGTTPGKALVQLRVVGVDGSPLGLLDAFVRTLLRMLWVTPALGQAFLVLDAIMVRRSEMEQRIGDRAAESVVAVRGEGPKR